MLTKLIIVLIAIALLIIGAIEIEVYTVLFIYCLMVGYITADRIDKANKG